MARVIKIGRNQNNDCIINNAMVSGNHGDLYIYDNGNMQYVDHSTNGTLINGHMTHNASYNVSSNDVLVLPGNVSLQVSHLLIGQQRNEPTIVSYAPVYGANDKMGMSDSGANSSKSHHYRSSTVKPSLGFGEALSLYFQRYAEFSGRSRRQEYWFIMLWNMIFVLIPFVNLIWCVITIVPGIALATRRLHDTGRSGWNWFWILLPFIGSIILFVFSLLDSEGDNEYGESPKYY